MPEADAWCRKFPAKGHELLKLNSPASLTLGWFSIRFLTKRTSFLIYGTLYSYAESTIRQRAGGEERGEC